MPARIGRAVASLATLAFTLLGSSAHAIDRVTMEIGSVVAAGTRLAGVVVDVRPLDDEHASLAVTIERADVAQELELEPLRSLRMSCESTLLSGTRARCETLTLSAARSPLGALNMSGSADYRGDEASVAVRMGGLALAGGTLRAGARHNPERWRATADLEGATLDGLRKTIERWVEVPATWSATGRITAAASIVGGTSSQGAAGIRSADASLSITGLDLTNEPGTIVAEKTNLSIEATLDPGDEAQTITAHIRGTAGQALAGPVLLDFNAHPLDLRATGVWRDEALTFSRIDVAQPGLLTAHGNARLVLEPTVSLDRARLVIDRLIFPAAYPSFMQLTLASTDFGDLTTSGAVTGEVELQDNEVSRVSMELRNLQMRDRAGDFFIQNLEGNVNWTSAEADAPASWLTWSSAGAYGLMGGASRLDFRAYDASFELIGSARLPIFDGAIAIDRLAIDDLGAERIGLEFSGSIEPISMAPISRAFGWPEFSGRISGSIPAVRLSDNELRFAGDVEARIFDGRVVASNVRLVDPLGSWPRLFADVRARNLDLALLTDTFSVGSITGRVDMDVLGIELFDWTPVAFDGRIETSPGDRSRHRISARAVSELANIGGGGGGVAQALQSGILRFFDEYSYDRLGLRCKLENDICLMAGVAPAGDDGYYIVEGSGIPRIDIIGNEGRVNWPQLLSQIQAGMASESVVVQ